MPRSIFRQAEQEFLEGYIDRWSKLKQRPSQGQTYTQGLAQRTELIREITKAFLLTFPERDPTASDPSPIIYNEADLALLPKRARQWLTNNTRTPGGAEVKQKQSTRGRTHARNLATQRYSQEINEVAKTVRTENPGIHHLNCFNEATTRFLQKLEQDDPQAFLQLHEDAVSIRESAEKDYTDHVPEVLEKLLKDFPAKLSAEMREHGRALPVHIWCIAGFGTPSDPALKTYTVSTSSIDAITRAPAHKKMRKEFLDWLSQALGPGAACQVETAIRMVYPDLKSSFRPRIPIVVGVASITSKTLRGWLRTYFNYQYLWQGGRGSVNWKRLAKDDRYHYVSASCFPLGIKILKPPDEMTRPEAEQWYQWLVSSQEGRLAPEQVFQFAVVEVRPGSDILVFSEPITTRPPRCQLVWTPEEKLYALRMDKEAEDAQSKPEWKELPLARSRMIYEPFEATMRTLISTGCLDEYQTAAIATSVFEMERYGPIHTRDMLTHETSNAYMPEEMSDARLRALLVSRILPPKALQEEDPEYPLYALPTFIHFVKTSTRLRHRASGTWRGGPFGVRWIIAVYVHFASAFTIYELDASRIPSRLADAFDSINFRSMKSMLIKLGSWILEELQRTIAALKGTFQERASAWRTAVVRAYLAFGEDYMGNESVAIQTHGIPRRRTELRDCYTQLQNEDPELTMGPDDLQFQPAKRAIRRRALVEEEMSDRDSNSGEEIEFPSDEEGSEEESSSSGHDDDEVNNQSVLATNVTLIGCIERDIDPASSVDDADLIVQSAEDSPLAEPSFQVPSVYGQQKSDSEDGEDFPGLILGGSLTPDPRPQPTPSKSKARLTLEVVIPTPSRRKAGVANPGSHMTPDRAGRDDQDPDEPGDINQSIAQSRPRRSVTRNQRAENAIRGLPKGRYESGTGDKGPGKRPK